MNRRFVHFTTFSATIPLLVLSPVALADSLTVANPGFESPILADGAYTSGSIPGWTVTPGVVGVFNPPASQFAGEAPEGHNVAFSHGPVLSQVLSDVLTANLQYTLEVDVGSPLTLAFPGYTVQLKAGGSVLAQDNSALSPALGSFATSVVTFAALPANPYLGQALEISISSNGIETDFDNVRLSTTPIGSVPEPGIFWLFGLGLCGLLGYRALPRR